MKLFSPPLVINLVSLLCICLIPLFTAKGCPWSFVSGWEIKVHMVLTDTVQINKKGRSLSPLQSCWCLYGISEWQDISIYQAQSHGPPPSSNKNISIKWTVNSLTLLWFPDSNFEIFCLFGSPYGAHALHMWKIGIFWPAVSTGTVILSCMSLCPLTQRVERPWPFLKSTANS